jgi:hypothetical protein
MPCANPEKTADSIWSRRVGWLGLGVETTPVDPPESRKDSAAPSQRSNGALGGGLDAK